MQALPDYKECVRLLTYISIPQSVLNHVIFTTQTALKITKQLKKRGFPVDCNLVLAGAMLHDVGRSWSHDVDHGIIGSHFLRQIGLPEKLARMAEIHLFAGITKTEAKELGLPFRDYLPVTLEEKIITYADNISKRERLLTIDEVVERYSKYIEQSHPIMFRVRKLHEEMANLLGNIVGL